MSTNTTTQNKPVIVAGKPVANYALAVQARLADGATIVTLRARGRHADRVIDAANMAVKFGLGLTRGEARWGEETAPGGKAVSFLEIDLVAAH